MKKNLIIFLILILSIGTLVIVSFIGLLSNPIEKGNQNSLISNVTVPSTLPQKELLHITNTNGSLKVNATVFQNARSLPVYRGSFEKNGSIDLQLQQIGKQRINVTTEQEAPEVAKKALEPYGGLPSDAVYDGASTSYTEYYENSSLVRKEPVFTTVFYSREINKMPIIGDSNTIKLTLGTNGELLWIFKIWRNYTYSGDVPIITIDKAIDKLERQELIESSWHPEEGNITIDSIGQGYYAHDVGNSETILEPLWMMFGTGASGSRLGFYVYARQFANFTATPVTATPSDEIAFRSTSDGSPTRQFWDFGDGSNTTLRNPVHSYQKSGTYNVTLTAWNDMGSDSITKNIIIR